MLFAPYVCNIRVESVSYHHQTWYTHTDTLWQSLGMHWPGGQKVKVKSCMVTKTTTIAWLL